MARLYVIATGLMVLVEPNQGGAMLLLRRVGGEQVGGKAVRPHTPRLLFRRKGAPAREELILKGEEVEFLPSGQGAVTIDRSGLLRLGELAGENLKAKGGCVGANPEQDCVIQEGGEKRRLLAGRVHLASGGDIKALQLDELPLNRISTAIATQLVGATSFDGSGDLDLPSASIANGLLYQRDIDGGEASLRVDGQDIGLEPIAPGKLGNLPAPPDGQAFVVWVLNVGDVPDTPSGLNEVFDDDFDLLYDFVDGSPSRFIPKLRPVRIHGQGDPPDKCIPATVPGT